MMRIAEFIIIFALIAVMNLIVHQEGLKKENSLFPPWFAKLFLIILLGGLMFAVILGIVPWILQKIF